jgi:hypothetical protein
VAFVLGKVKFGNNSLGNYMAYGDSNPAAKPIDKSEAHFLLLLWHRVRKAKPKLRWDMAVTSASARWKPLNRSTVSAFRV